MRIVFNGETVLLVESCTLQDLLSRDEISKNKHLGQYVVALNQDFIHQHKYSETWLQEGDEVEMLGAVVGG